MVAARSILLALLFTGSIALAGCAENTSREKFHGDGGGTHVEYLHGCEDARGVVSITMKGESGTVQAIVSVSEADEVLYQRTFAPGWSEQTIDDSFAGSSDPEAGDWDVTVIRSDDWKGRYVLDIDCVKKLQ